jgi:hypothetical protein
VEDEPVSLIDRLANEADQCRNDGADDIARLLVEAVAALRPRLDATVTGGIPSGVQLPDKAAFLIHYDDQEKHAEIWTGEAAARARFKDISQQWNAHLFVKLESNSRDDRNHDANAHIVSLNPGAPSNAKDGAEFVADFFRARGCYPSLVQCYEAGQASAKASAQPAQAADRPHRAWTQDGFAVISRVAPEGDQALPLFHGFVLPEWEAERKLEALASLPSELRQDAAVVPARLSFAF